MEVEYLNSIVSGLTDFPEDIKIDRSVDERGVLLVLHLNQADMGKVIGKDGATAKSIRSLMATFGGRTKQHISIKIFDQRKS